MGGIHGCFFKLRECLFPLLGPALWLHQHGKVGKDQAFDSVINNIHLLFFNNNKKFSEQSSVAKGIRKQFGVLKEFKGTPGRHQETATGKGVILR